MNEIDILKIVVFILHYFFFGLTVFLYLLKFHKKSKLKFVLFSIAVLWIIFGGIDFILKLKEILSMFNL